MNFQAYKKEFIYKAVESGYSGFYINKCLVYAEKLFDSGVPVIYNTSHLSALVGYKKGYLKRAVAHTVSFYRHFHINKKNGELRSISEPLPSLKEIQIWILENILSKIKVSKFAKAYIRKQSLKGNLVFHKDQDFVYTLDIQDFFSSITIFDVEKIFLSCGYSKVLSNLLAKLCTLNGFLPQGAPTSPALSNIFMKSFDDTVSEYCVMNDICYTRYADDLTFSWKTDEDIEITNFHKFLENQIKEKGLNFNTQKTKLMSRDKRQVVTGVVVNVKPQVTKEKRNKIRQAMYYIMKYGMDAHQQRLKIKRANYHAHLLGQINFILFINPNDKEFINYKMYLNRL